MSGRPQPPKGYNSADYPSFAVTVDVVILTMQDGRLHVLLVRRRDDPYAGAWALPGGFKRPDETLDEAAERELREETGLHATHLAQFGAYGDPGRDPRTNVVTVAYLAVIADPGATVAGSDAAGAQFWPAGEAVRNLPLAFDHRRILSDAIDRAAEQLEQTDLATKFVGDTFTLSELQNVYEQLWDKDGEIDPANFRRSLTSSSDRYVEATGRRGEASTRGGRPPELFRAGDAWQSKPPVRRPRRGEPR